MTTRGPRCGVSNPCLRGTPGTLGNTDFGDVDAPIRLPQRPGALHLDEDVEGAVLLARRGKPRRGKRASRPSKKTGSVLYLYDGADRSPGEEILAKELYNAGRRDMVGIDSWDDLAKAIKKYSKLGQLVLSFHGYPGGIIVGGEGRDLNERTVKSLFVSKSGDVQTQIDDIAFVGCNIGNRPARMAAFGELFAASTVSGYTWWIVRQEIDITIPEGSTESSLRKALAPYAKWVRPAINYVALALAARRTDAKRKLLVMYGSYEGDFIERYPVDFGASRGFKPIGEAEEMKLSPSRAGAQEKEFNDSPVVPFYRVTVELK